MSTELDKHCSVTSVGQKGNNQFGDQASIVVRQVGAVVAYRSGLSIFSKRRGPRVGRVGFISCMPELQGALISKLRCPPRVSRGTPILGRECADPEGMEVVCESEIMPGRASPCVVLRKPSGETLIDTTQLAGSIQAFSPRGRHPFSSCFYFVWHVVTRNR